MTIWQQADVEIHLGAMETVLPDLAIHGDLALTDPPYGIAICSGSGKLGRPVIAKVTDYEKQEWDEEGLTPEQFETLKAYSRHQVVFGYNHLADVLGPCSCPIVWDKKRQNGWDNNFADVEIAWSSLAGTAKCYRHRWVGAMRESEREAGDRVHPTQKPVALMAWILEKWTEPGDLILDPFLGSGTTAIACHLTGRRCLGVERDEKYFRLACQRVAKAMRPGAYRDLDYAGEAPLFVGRPDLMED